MVEQLSSENINKPLLTGKTGPAQPRPGARYRQQRQDIIVENATEKRYLWTARAFAIIFAISLCCNVILTYAISTTLPLYRIEPHLFSFEDKSEQVYNVVPSRKIYEYKYLTELFIREYVLLRNSFINDVDEMERRWGTNSMLREMSSNPVYKNFKDNFAKDTLEKIREYNLTRNVKIVNVTEIDGSKGQVWWQVEFSTSDMAPTYETPRIDIWIASIRIGYRAKKVKFNERLKNPLGFTVTDYKVQKRK